MTGSETGINWDGVYGTIDFGGLSTDEIMSEIRPKSDSVSG